MTPEKLTGLRAAGVASLCAVLLAGCAASGSRVYAVEKRTASECLVATDTAQCRLAHDLAGGYPLNLGQGR